MKKLAIIGDVHAHAARLATVLEMLRLESPDIALLVGDIGVDPPWSEQDRAQRRTKHDASVRRVIEKTRDTLSCETVYVPGNHDLPQPPVTSATNVDGRVVSLAGLNIAGFGGAGPQRFGFPYEWSETEADERLERSFGRLVGRVDVFLCHAPPFGGALDRLPDGQHVGSRTVARWVARMNPRLFVCGHIHESFGAELLEGVPCLNAGALGEPYGQEIGWIVTWGTEPVRIESLQHQPGAATKRSTWLARG